MLSTRPHAQVVVTANTKPQLTTKTWRELANGIVRGIGCIFETAEVETAAEGARTRAALFASKDGVALKISQDGEISLFANGQSQFTAFSPVS